MNSGYKQSLLLGFILSCPLAYANEQQADTTLELDAINIETAGEQLAELYFQPRSTNIISREKIENYGFTSPGDIFKGEVGVVVGDIRNSGAVELNIRGMQGQSRVPFAIDGVQQLITSYRGYAGVSDRSYLDPELLQKVAVVKGPSVAANSMGAVGGMVHAETISATDIIQPGKKFAIKFKQVFSTNQIAPDISSRNETIVGHDPWGSFFKRPEWVKAEGVYNYVPRKTGKNKLKYNSTALALAYKHDNFDILAAANYYKTGNYYAGSRTNDAMKDSWFATVYKPGKEVTNTSNEMRTWLLKSNIELTENQKITLSYLNLHTFPGEIMGSQILRADKNYVLDENGIPKKDTNGNFIYSADTSVPQWDVGNVKLQNYSLRYHWQPQNPLINLQANIWHSNLDSETANANPFTAPVSDNAGNVNISSEYATKAKRMAYVDNRKTGLELSNTSEFNTALGLMIWNYGLAYQNEKLRPKSGHEATLEQLNSGAQQRNGKRDEYSLFSSLQWHLTDNFIVNLGARYSEYSATDNNPQVRAKPYAEVNPKTYRLRIEPSAAEKYKALGYQVVDDPASTEVWFTWAETEPGYYSRENVAKELDQFAKIDKSDYYYDNGSYNQPYLTNSDDGEQRPAFDSKQQFANLNFKERSFQPSIGLTWFINDSTMFYANYNRGVRMPSLFETTHAFSAEPRANLKAEQAKNFEIGLSKQFEHLIKQDNNLFVKLAYFDNRTKNYISRRLDDSATVGAGAGLGLSIYNMDYARFRGLELQSNFTNNYFYLNTGISYNINSKICSSKEAEHWRATAVQRDFNNLGEWAEIKNLTNCTERGFPATLINNQIPPKYSAAIDLGTYLFEKKLQLGVRVNMVGKSMVPAQQAAFREESFTSHFIPWHAYKTFDAYVKYKPNKYTSLLLSIENLTDQYYLDALAKSITPAPGRKINTSLVINF